ncbi:MAG: hypothetical protein ACU836_02785 [Gammaproteobacteria bacterium]
MLPLMLRSLLVLTFFSLCSIVHAEIAVIVNANIEDDSISRNEIINIYMGRLRRFPSGPAARPIDLPSSSPDKAEFYHLLVNKPLSEIDAYWARLIFSGRTSPPDIEPDATKVQERVATSPNAIGYLDRKEVDERLLTDKRIKIIFILAAETKP